MKKVEKNIQEDICRDYLNNMSNKELLDKYNIHRTTVQRILKKNNIELRKQNVTSRKNFTINFKGDILTNNDAYILGLIWSDGNLSKNCIEIVLQKNDENLLKDISQYVYSKNTLTYREGKNTIFNGKEYLCKPQVRFRITSKEVANKLRKIGLIENKSLICRLPQIDLKMMPHFIRGLLDGDGCIYTKNIRSCKVDIISNHIMANEISNIINKTLKIRSKVYLKTENVSTFTISGRLQILKFLEWIYKDADLKLDRKYKKYKELI